MKKECGSIVLIACLLFFIFPIPLANSFATNAEGSDFRYYVNPTIIVPNSYVPNYVLYNTVAELRRAYDLNPLYAAGYDGSGQTVVIIDAYGYPTLYEDFLSFITWQNANAGANLPWTTMEEIQSHLRIYYPAGAPTFNARNVPRSEIFAAVETILDVCMVHAIAPGADIALVLAPNANTGNLLNIAVNYAIKNRLGCVISESFGVPEYLLRGNNYQVAQAHANYVLASQPSYKMTVFAVSGDAGATEGGPFNSALYPASDPYVTGAGGTNLFMNCEDGFKEGTGAWDGKDHTGSTYGYEIAGNDYEAMVADGYPSPFETVTAGGAMSTLFPLPSWQTGIALTYANGTAVSPSGRCVSDVSFDSGAYGGLGSIFFSALGPTLELILGGTSACAPFWSALTAIACQYAGHNLGFINSQLYSNRAALYAAGAFHDVTIGDNTYPHDNPVIGYKATTGWDAPTGIGSPDAAILVPIMATW